MKEKLYRFMQGRYGQDQFARFLLFLSFVFLIFDLIFHKSVFAVFFWIFMIYTYYRMLSKNHQARYAENQKYLQATGKLRYWFSQQKTLANERKYHHIYVCPKCRQKIRIPKGKGKIMVRCPKCSHEFQKRS